VQASQRNGGSAPFQHDAADLFLRQSFRKIRGFLTGLNDNDDKAVLKTAGVVLHGNS
jgi:hypothetical protein